MDSSSGLPKLCINSQCQRTLSSPRAGWKCKNGGFAELCDQCGSAFDDGTFCIVYHSDSCGWSRCESCKKQIHCGCMASSHLFVMLDHGGIKCLPCASADGLLTPDPASPSAPSSPSANAEGTKDNIDQSESS